MSAEWPSSTPEAEGLDALTPGDPIGRIRRRHCGAIDSLLVVRHGKLVVEEYFNGGAPGQAHTMQSVSKSVTSLLAGLAIDRGALKPSDRVTPWFPQYQPIASLDDRK